MPDTAAAVGLLASAVSLGTIAPQAVLLWVRRSRRGVSLLAWGLMGVSFSLWIGYGTRTSHAIVAGTNMIGVLLISVLLLGGARAEALPLRRTSLGAAAFAAGVVGMATIGLLAPGPVVAAAVLVPVCVRSPQLLRSLRTLREQTPSDVSVQSWTLGLLSAVLWTAYGVLLPDPYVTWGSVGAVLVSAGVLALELVGRGRTAAP